MIKNGANAGINFGELPDLSEALLGWFVKMSFIVITKVSEGFKIVEQEEVVSFMGVWQPMGAQKLMMKPEGQRDWKWFTCHSDTSLELKPDDKISYKSAEYRVMEKLDYTEYGYYEYHIVEGYFE